MNKFEPIFPTPSKNKVGLLKTFFQKKHSWLDSLYQKSYTMKMGQVKMPGLDLHVVNEPKEVHKILVENVKTFPKSKMLGQLLYPLLGNSIFTTNGEEWKKQREMLNPSFEMAKISKVFPLMKEATDDMMNTLKEGEIDIDPIMTFVTADIIFRTIISAKLDKETANIIVKAFSVFQAETAKTAMRIIFKIPKFLWVFSGERKRIEAANSIRTIIGKMIESRNSYEKEFKDFEDKQFKDILSSIKSTNKNGVEFTNEEILNQVSMLFLAGHETSASALTSAIYLIATHPEIQENAYQEFMGIPNNQHLTSENVKNMELINNIFKETLRLYPPVGFFARQTSIATIIRNKFLKEGSTVVVSPWLMHRNPNVWESVNSFIPDRFRNLTKEQKESYIPFGAGPRVCIGSSFATQEAVLILATLLREYKIELKKGFTPDIVGRLTVRSENGMKVILTKRETK